MKRIIKFCVVNIKCAGKLEGISLQIQNLARNINNLEIFEIAKEIEFTSKKIEEINTEFLLKNYN